MNTMPPTPLVFQDAVSLANSSEIVAYKHRTSSFSLSTATTVSTTSDERASVDSKTAFLVRLDEKEPKDDDTAGSTGLDSIADPSYSSDEDEVIPDGEEEAGSMSQSNDANVRERSSITLDDSEMKAMLQEELELKRQPKGFFQRQREKAKRNALKGEIADQIAKLRKAHGTHTLLSNIPDDSEGNKLLTATSYPSLTGEGLSVSVKFSSRNTKSFYKAMKSFSAFHEVTHDKHFQVAPDNWHVVITDICGSTKAIEAGRYRDVNTIGAASISVVMRLLEEDFPFVFGGDGATLMVPPTEIGRVLEALLRLQRLSEEQFHLGLRVGHITVKEVKEAGGNIEVAKHELSAGRCVAVFRGGGLTVAEACIKGQQEKYCVRYRSADEVELEGLSCRWNPIQNKRGKIMSLLVCAREDKEEAPSKVYEHVIQELDKIYEGRLDEANPVNSELMTYQTIKENYVQEKRFHSNTWTSNFLSRVSDIFLAAGIFKHGVVEPTFFDKDQYMQSMRTNADHRKFDDTLRMVMDCSAEQAVAIETLMDGLRQEGKLHYGIFLSDTALMTCYLEDLADGQHIHFIDGGNGGYAMAAKQLKAQMKESKSKCNTGTGGWGR